MDLILPNSLSALREDETFTRHNITIDPEAFLAVIRHAELGCRMGGEGQYFHNNVDKQSFEQLIPEDSALYDVWSHKERIQRGIDSIADNSFIRYSCCASKISVIMLGASCRALP
jgi:hypothetical protein